MSKNLLTFTVLFGVILLACSAHGQDPKQDVPATDAAAKDAGEPKVEESGQLAGHSYHGEAFNEGPRQKAYLMGGTGNVEFPVTTKNEEVQKFINQGVGQLHGFWTLEAERSFRHAASLDPKCAMAYWGAALANLSNDKRAKGFIAEAVKLRENCDEREKMYLDALNAYFKAGSSKRKQRSEQYTKALEEILAKYPDDLEAKAFLALQIYRNRSSSIPIVSYFAVDALIKDIIAVKPLHPAHHFRIHLWDGRKPEQALTSAAVCGQGSPGIAHMWHMPGHIYSRVKRYQDAVWQQEASARVDHAHMMRDRVLPDQIHNFAHNNEWLIRNMIYIGRVHDAVNLAKNMVSLPRHPKHNTLSRRGSTYYGRLRLFNVLSNFELWKETIELCDSGYLEPTEKEDEQVKRLQYLATAHFRGGDAAKGETALGEIQTRFDKQTKDRDNAVAEAEKKVIEQGKEQKDIDKAKKAAEKKFATKIRNLEKAVKFVRGQRAFAQGDAELAVTLLTQAGANATLQARAKLAAGKTDEALEQLRKYSESKRNEVLPLTHLIAAYWQAGKREEAGEAFKKLRDLSSSIDLDVPLFADLGPIAKELGHPADWRVVKPLASDISERPALDSLGPFRWQPSPAPAFALQDEKQAVFASKQLRGKPHVLIFYLGFGCLHCAEQLQAFGPVMSDFESAGISMLAISSDDHEGLKRSVENYDGGPMPIPLLANAEMDVFKTYRAFDDFENQPLHGTFIIDGDGMVLWQDISYEPFMDHKFVLKEAQRLLSQRGHASATCKVEEPTTVEAEAEAEAVEK